MALALRLRIYWDAYSWLGEVGGSLKNAREGHNSDRPQKQHLAITQG